MKKTIKKIHKGFKVKIWDEFGQPVYKTKGSSKDITKGIKNVFEKYN